MWSAGGQRLVALSPRELLVYDARGRLLSARAAPGGSRWADAALSPDGRTLALVSRGAGSAVIAEPLAGRMPATRRVLAGTGLGQIAWSPDGRWLLITWPAANQWVFVRLSGPPRILAASRIAQQFSAGARIGFPQLEGWCCTGTGAAG
jgi:dipeptidyl aminopeptidase/acylaminoacyl peptidase